MSYIAPTDEELRLAEERKRREAEARQRILDQRRTNLEQMDAERQARREQERQDREEPIKAVVAILQERLGSDLPRFAAAAKKAGTDKVLAFLDSVITEDALAQRAKADRVNEAAAVADRATRVARREDEALLAL